MVLIKILGEEKILNVYVICLENQVACRDLDNMVFV